MKLKERLFKSGKLITGKKFDKTNENQVTINTFPQKAKVMAWTIGNGKKDNSLAISAQKRLERNREENRKNTLRLVSNDTYSL